MVLLVVTEKSMLVLGCGGYVYSRKEKEKNNNEEY